MWRWTMDAQGTMRLMFDTMDAYDRADFDRLAEIYPEDAQWRNANPNGPHCHNRDDIFAMFRQRMDAGIRVGFDEMRSTPTRSC
jgi:ketosteroid isomerase-like protein